MEAPKCPRADAWTTQLRSCTRRDAARREVRRGSHPLLRRERTCGRSPQVAQAGRRETSATRPRPCAEANEQTELTSPTETEAWMRGQTDECHRAGAAAGDWVKEGEGTEAHVRTACGRRPYSVTAWWAGTGWRWGEWRQGAMRTSGIVPIKKVLKISAGKGLSRWLGKREVSRNTFLQLLPYIKRV